MAFVALINRSSGSVPDTAEGLLRQRLGSALLRLVACDADGLDEALGSLALRDGDTLLVWGGDGTAAAALGKAKGVGASVLPLPGGTMNLLHKRVHGQASDWEEILDRALESEPRPLAYGVANEVPFYVALMLGRLTRLAEIREALRDGAPIAAAKKAVDANALDLETVMEAHLDGETVRATAAAAFLPEALAGDRFDVALIDPDSLLALASMSANALVADWRSADGVVFRKAGQAVVKSLNGAAFESLADGERVSMGGEIRLQLRLGEVLVKSARPPS